MISKTDEQIARNLVILKRYKKIYMTTTKGENLVTNKRKTKRHEQIKKIWIAARRRVTLPHSQSAVVANQPGVSFHDGGSNLKVIARLTGS